MTDDLTDAIERVNKWLADCGRPVCMTTPSGLRYADVRLLCAAARAPAVDMSSVQHASDCLLYTNPTRGACDCSPTIARERGEPVAWLVTHPDGYRSCTWTPEGYANAKAATEAGGGSLTPLYAAPIAPERAQEPNSVHFSVEHPDGSVTDYGLRPTTADKPHD